MWRARSSFRVSVLARLILASGLIASAGFPAARADDLAAVEAARARVVADSLDEPALQAALAQLDAARAQQRQAATLRAQLAALHAEAAEGPSRVEELRALLGQDREQALADWAAQLPEDADGETLERLLAQERVALDVLAARIDAACASG